MDGSSPLDACYELELPSIVDSRGALTFGQSLEHIPFPVRRFYALYEVPPEARRGAHAHIALRQVCIVFGRCTVTLDDGVNRRVHILDSPSRAIHIGPMVWRELSDFTPNTVYLVLASELYDEADYIRDYDSYLAARGLS